MAIFLRTNSTAKRAFRSRHLNVSWNVLSRWCVRHKKKRHLANVLFDVLFQQTVGYNICVILQVHPSATWQRTTYLDHKTAIYSLCKEWRLPSTKKPNDKINIKNANFEVPTAMVIRVIFSCWLVISTTKQQASKR